MTAAYGTVEFACNLALGHLGQPEIASFTGDMTTRARKMRQFLPVARDELLRHKPWNFATAWVTPALDPVQSQGDLKNRYPLPADCLRVRFIKGDNRREWAIETAAAAVGGVDVETSIMVTNIDAPVVCYTRRVEAVRLWDAMFLPAFGLLLAGYAATSLGKSATWGAEKRQEAIASIADAAGVDAKEKHERCRPEGRFSRARRGPGRDFSGMRLQD